MEFHNVSELETINGLPGLRLQRFPYDVRNGLGHLEHERGRFYSQISVGCEIRFVTDAKFIKIGLSSLEKEGVVYVYKGDLLHSVHSVPAGVITTLHLEEPLKLDDLEPSSFTGNGFSPRVWRFLFGKNTTVTFNYLDTFGHGCRPPMRSEGPKVTWLAYGSSITFGGDTNLYSNAYVQQAAKRLGWDILNKGIAGSCFCDKVIAEYLASIKSDVVTLELGVNMRGRFSPEEFEQRVRYLIKQLRAHDATKPIVVLGIFPNGASFAKNQDGRLAKDNVILSNISREIIRELADDNLHFVAGDQVLTNISHLSTDLLHPSDDGHIMMGENLARLLSRLAKSITL